MPDAGYPGTRTVYTVPLLRARDMTLPGTRTLLCTYVNVERLGQLEFIN